MNGTGPGSPPAPRPAGAPARRTVLALGSNLGDRLATLQGGVDALLGGPPGPGSSGLGSSGLALVALSPVYETVPVGGPPQPEYLNAVLIAETTLPATALLRRVQAVEAAFGRVRQEVWGPRTLDVDVIVYGDVVSDDPELMLPHPRAWERAFVLAPWLDADPDAEIPGQGRVAGLLEAAVARNGGQPGVRRLADVQLRPPA
ncbi:MAG TPA: 2-amino-4-hydroxy-6-hydroxymethyldihydropteridine diphosphokinase [Streptosporangiaceae bacterium]|jgi:dihydroneopterin aldolase/2-amino-4-hydroxy-6-hydroxymethyldihydropteridine diphosphokinase|nr:2-amino-4-hydroxy-6-hydroxymethyldihydropteridine diphosphokinase [Streptosporangiaceae bacterium]